jgi:membrane AbrB-like protein
MLLRLIATIAVASTSGLICKRMKIPAGALIGAMFGVLLLNIFTGKAYFPMSLRPYFRFLAGVYIGCRITQKDVQNLHTVIPAAIIMSTGLISLSLLGGYLISSITGLDLKTALLSTAPGGVHELSIIAEDVGRMHRRL